MVQSLNGWHLAAVIIGILSVARTARLIGFDDYPPMVWLRIKWDDAVRGNWNKLVRCPFCATPYLAAGMAVWWWLADGHWTWWVINGVWGLSYLAAILVAYDEPPE